MLRNWLQTYAFHRHLDLHSKVLVAFPTNPTTVAHKAMMVTCRVGSMKHIPFLLPPPSSSSSSCLASTSGPIRDLCGTTYSLTLFEPALFSNICFFSPRCVLASPTGYWRQVRRCTWEEWSRSPMTTVLHLHTAADAFATCMTVM